MPISVLLKSYNAQTGALVLQTTDTPAGATVEYQIIGLRGWGGPDFVVESYRRTQDITFSPQARVNGTVITGANFTTTAAGFPPAGSTPTGPTATTATQPTATATGSGPPGIYGLTDRQHIGYHGDKMDLFARVTPDGKLYLVGIERNEQTGFLDANKQTYFVANPNLNKPLVMSSNKPGGDWLLNSGYGELLTATERALFAVQLVNQAPLPGLTNADFPTSLAPYPGTIADETERKNALRLLIKRPNPALGFVTGSGGATGTTPTATATTATATATSTGTGATATPTDSNTVSPGQYTPVATDTGTNPAIEGGTNPTDTAGGTATGWIKYVVAGLAVIVVGVVVWVFFIKK